MLNPPMARSQKLPAATAMTGMKQKGCPREDDCSCLGTLKSRSPTYQSLLHMDECDDPDCTDLEQLRELQKSLDRFTDYDNYERCCDGHHTPGACCSGVADPCCDSNDAADCDDCFDDCDECVEEHVHGTHVSNHGSPMDFGSPIKCDEDCEQCEEECEVNGHERKDCPQDHHSSWDSCITTCGICVDPTPLPIPGSDAEMQLFGVNSLLPHIVPCDESCTPPVQQNDFDLPNIPSTDNGFDFALDHWQTFQQAHHCAPDPCLANHGTNFQLPQHIEPNFGFSFACDPTLPGNQYAWQNHERAPPTCTFQVFNNLDLNRTVPETAGTPILPLEQHVPALSTHTPTESVSSPSINSKDMISVSSSVPPSKLGKSCQWLMPCGSICAQTFARTEDLKKHVKNSHLTLKDTVSCRWGHSCTASFASVAALTGHISKKHLAPLYAQGTAATVSKDSASSTHSSNNNSPTAESHAFKCLHPGCTKSFAYKQVRDDHMASHTGTNRAHCPICHQWLNAEGSNFRRHMASHRPEHEHMRCKHQHLGCRRKFPRRDNLRRHEACCKYGKRAAAVAAEAEEGHHHHHHGRVHTHGHHHHHFGHRDE